MSRLRSLLGAGVLTCALAAAPADADPDEAWVTRAPVDAGTRPLLVLLVDTSARMAESLVVPPPYDPDVEYMGGRCRLDRVYWRRGPGPAPDCRTEAWVSVEDPDPARGFRCAAGQLALATTGVYIADRAAQWEPRTGGGYWRALRSSEDGAVECRGDRGRHGSEPGAWFAAQGSGGPWNRDPTTEPRWDAPPLSDVYLFFSGNYLNYLETTGNTETTPRYAWLASIVSTAAASVGGLDLALARLSHDGGAGDDAGRGGMMVLVDQSLPDAAERLSAVLGSWQPAGPAPLGETLAEVSRWLAGSAVGFGLDTSSAPGQPLPSTPASRRVDEPQRYRSPFTDACRAVTLGLVSPGERSADDGAMRAALDLPDFGAANCEPDCWAGLVRWLDVSDLTSSLPGRQFARANVVSVSPWNPMTREAARAAGTRLIDMSDPLAIVTLAARALQHDAAVAAADRLSAAAPSRIDTGVFYGLSDPGLSVRWPGNVRRYELTAPPGPMAAAQILDRDGRIAFDPGTGWPVPASTSSWSDSPDGASTQDGGAAARLPAPADRLVYSDLTADTLLAASNFIGPDNPALTPDLLGLSSNDRRTGSQLLRWLLGHDSFDDDLDGDTTEARDALGDPGLSPPAVIHYGDSTGATLVFVSTGDGMLHALDGANGVERWAFLPRRLLGRTANLALGAATVSRSHGLDGRVVVHLRDLDGDGRIEGASGEEALLYVGLGRAGTGYYGFDVSDPDRPRLLWSRQDEDLPGFGDSWPEPVIAAVDIDPTRQSPDRLAVILAGGFDPAEDARPGSQPGPGAALTILDARTGARLWTAGGPALVQADLRDPDLSRSLPSAPRVLDRDGDGFADLAYAVDIGGQLWRFGLPSAGRAASVRRIATVGDPGDAPERRFFHTPDVIFEPVGGRARFAIAFGSGWLSRPRETKSEDRFYAVFDWPMQSTGADPLRETDLIDITEPTAALPPDARGWMLRLTRNGAGEKTAGSSVTVDHRLRFTTYQPLARQPAAPCGPPAGKSRLYTLDVRDGRPVNWVNDEPAASEELPASGLPPGIRVSFPVERASAGCAGSACRTPVAIVGGRSIGLDFRNDPVKSSWRQLDVPAD